MIIKNKRTREMMIIGLDDFKDVFSREIQEAFESYKQTQGYNIYYHRNNDLESDFYLDLRWNFNNFSNSAWYIERM